MAQVVHGIAPGASLLVATLGQSPAETAQNIADLVAAGANVITDDIFWSNEPNYQKGIISQEIDIAKSKGVSYFASSGNNNAVQAVSTSSPAVGYPIGRHQSNTYRPTACPSWVVPPEGATSYDCMDFSPDGSDVPYGLVQGTASLGASYAYLRSFQHILGWSEPVNGVKTRLQLQYYSIYNSGGTEEVCFDGASAASSTLTPARLASWTEASSCQPVTGSGYDAAMVVVRDTSKAGYGTPQVKSRHLVPVREPVCPGGSSTKPRATMSFKAPRLGTTAMGVHGLLLPHLSSTPRWSRIIRLWVVTSSGSTASVVLRRLHLCLKGRHPMGHS